MCPALIGELRDVLTRDRFRRWSSTDEAELFVTRVESEAEPWDDPVDVPAVTADPKGDYLVALYRNCNADLLVSGDSDDLLRAGFRSSGAGSSGFPAGSASSRRTSSPR